MNSPKENLIAYLRKTARDMGGIPSWVGLRQGNMWLVKGEPWEEVSLNEFIRSTRYVSEYSTGSLPVPSFYDQGRI